METIECSPLSCRFDRFGHCGGEQSKRDCTERWGERGFHKTPNDLRSFSRTREHFLHALGILTQRHTQLRLRLKDYAFGASECLLRRLRHRPVRKSWWKKLTKQTATR